MSFCFNAFRRTLVFPFALVVLGFSANAGHAQKVKTVLNSGDTANRYDIVVLGDGYKASEEAKFDADVKALSNYFFSFQPFKQYKSYFNLHSVFRASLESGASQPDKTPPIVKKTAYGATYNYKGKKTCLFIGDDRLAARDAALAPDFDGKAFILVNDSRKGQCNDPTFSVINRGNLPWAMKLWGFTYGLLGDEKEGTTGFYNGNDPNNPNITTSPFGTKWLHWIGSNGISVFAGAGGFKAGLYRPALDSMMRTPGKPYNAVCIEQLIKQVYVVVDAIEKPIPNATTFNLYRPSKKTFTFTNLVPGTSKITWFLDGKRQPNNGGAIVLDSNKLTNGTHKLLVFVQDLTSEVRNDPKKALLSQRTWTVIVGDPPKPDLSPLGVTPVPTLPRAGTPLRIDTKIRNLSTQVDAGAFRVEFFLSKDPFFTTSDIYLGSKSFSGLPKGGSINLKFNGVLPYFVDGGAWYLGVQVDRLNRVVEQNEQNNLVWRKLTTLSPFGCVRVLEYADPLQSSYRQDLISGTSGGFANMALTAPCNKGHWYVVLWGGKGTSPGIQLKPGMVLPLNFDPILTNFVLLNMNHIPFNQFIGKIDNNGHGFPYLSLPPKILQTTGLKTNFAALLLPPSANGGFTGVTNAVEQVFTK